MAAPKTMPVVLIDGTEGRGVKLTTKNVASIAEWVYKGKALDLYHEEDGTLRIFNMGGRAIRKAKTDDIVVKTKLGFTVIKAADFAKYIKI